MTHIRKLTDKLFGGINMSWLKVILFAIGAAAVTTVFLTVPVFERTSFYEMGVSVEAWILFAVIIMSNCKKPLESALKTFVFFLISQPLIYLFQVPFSYMGWGLFHYYYYWFLWTLLTFPAALAGWFIKKRNWLSLLIFTPVLCLLAWIGMGYLKSAMFEFPYHLLAAVFCFLQIVLYLFAFFRDWKQWLAGIILPAVIVGVILFATPVVDTSASMPLPDDPHLSANAVVTLQDSSCGTAEITDATGGYVRIHMVSYGPTEMIVTDGDREYRYTVSVVSSNGVPVVDVQPLRK